jgi:tetratricopeptide (TPR) repeat protein
VSESIDQEIRTLQGLRWSSRDPEGLAFAPLADALSRKGDALTAIEMLRDGISRNPDFATGHVIAAGVFSAQGMMAEAEFAARRSLDLDPDNIVALAILDRIRGELGDDGEQSLHHVVIENDHESVLADRVASPLECEPEESAVATGAKLPDKSHEDHPTSLAEPIHTRTLAELYFSQGFVGQALHVYRNLNSVQSDAADINARITELEGILCSIAGDPTPTGGSLEPVTKNTEPASDSGKKENLNRGLAEPGSFYEGEVEAREVDLGEGSTIDQSAAKPFRSPDGEDGEAPVSFGGVEPEKIDQYFDKLLGWETDKK